MKVPTELVEQRLVCICPHIFEPSEFVAYTACLSNIVSDIVGRHLGDVLDGAIMCELFGNTAWKRPLEISALAGELVESRKRVMQFECGELVAASRPEPKRRRADFTVSNASVMFALDCKVALKNAPRCLVEAARVLDIRQGGDGAQPVPAVDSLM